MAFVAIAIGALVPAAVMSIAAANLFTRNVWKEFVRADLSERDSCTWIASSPDVAPVGDMPVLGVTRYTGLVALVLNLVVATAVTLVMGRRGRADLLDETRTEEYDELAEAVRLAPTVGAGLS